VIRQAQVTGPGWTDEVARIFSPDYDGPQWDAKLGYRGRKKLKIMLDAEDICHSYAKAKWLQTGKWTGPLSEGIEKVMNFGAWGGGLPEEMHPPEGASEELDFRTPEIQTFVGMPSNLIEATNPQHLVDGYPDALREELGYIEKVDYDEHLQRDIYCNEWLRSLQDENRLFTWKPRNPVKRGDPLNRGETVYNTLQKQKNYRGGQMQIADFKDMPVLLSHTIGAGMGVKAGDEIEVLKPGKMFEGTWIPSAWVDAEVKAINYDGTFDVQIIRRYGDQRLIKRRGLNRIYLPMNKNEVYADPTYGADKYTAEFRLDFDREFMQAVPPSSLRLPKMAERIGDTLDSEACQDWYMCTTKDFSNFWLESHRFPKHMRKLRQAKLRWPLRLNEWKKHFLLSYEWVPSAEGLSFKPLPNTRMTDALVVGHGPVAEKVEIADTRDMLELRRLKDNISQIEEEMKIIPPAPDAVPSRPAGPRPEYVEEQEHWVVRDARKQQETEPVPYPLD